MRISDWSSDVCSSDLCAQHNRKRFLRPAGATTGPLPSHCRPNLANCWLKKSKARRVSPRRMPGRFVAGAFEQARLHQVDEGARLRAEKLALAPHHAVAARRKIQIGRASWRDSVCQYV